jgi:hypothetical protein
MVTLFAPFCMTVTVLAPSEFRRTRGMVRGTSWPPNWTFRVGKAFAKGLRIPAEPVDEPLPQLPQPLACSVAGLNRLETSSSVVTGWKVAWK